MTTHTRSIGPYIILAAFILCLTAARAENNGGSAYSRYGLGDIQYFPSSMADGMGGTGLAIMTSDEINRLNPAAWARIIRTRFSLGVMYEGYSTSDATQSNYLAGTVFNGFAVAFPVAPSSGVVFSFGAAPYSRINYNVVTPGSGSGLNYTLQYLGNGGISTGYVGLSAAVFSTLNLGAKFNYYFGNCNYYTRQTFTDNYTSADFERSMQFHGAGFTAGATYTGLKAILGLPEKTALTVGAVFSSAADLSTSTDRVYAFKTSTLTTHDTVSTPGGTTRIPVFAGGGISFATERYIVGSDFSYQNWSNFILSDAPQAEIRNSYRFSAGGEIQPERDISVPSWQRWRYRLGFFYNSSYYILQDQPINEIGISGGVGIPIIGDTKLNIGADYSFRGTTDNGLQKDRILRLSLTLSGGELWFVRPPEE